MLNTKNKIPSILRHTSFLRKLPPVLSIASLILPALTTILLAAQIALAAQPNIKVSLDMDTSGTTYSDPGAAGDNSMTVGTINSCLDVTSGSFPVFRTTHLVIQNVTDLVGWQARLNYDPSKVNLLDFNATPFTDTTDPGK